MESQPATPTSNSKRDWMAIVGAICACAVLAICASDGAISFAGVPAPVLCVALAFAIQWIGFLFAWILKTERFFDLFGSLTFITVVLVASSLSNQLDGRPFAIGVLVVVWAVRLGSFLTLRIYKDGSDRRFDEIKKSFSTFLMTWTLQGLWVSVTMGAGMAAILAASQAPVSGFPAAGLCLWTVGFLFESIADYQKQEFRKRPRNAGRFITTGFWAWSQHPNYFGEIVLWIGIAVIAFPALSGWAYVTLVSPVFVWLLLTRISGIPLLDASAEKRWGDDPEFQAYRERTPVLIPRPPRRR